MNNEKKKPNKIFISHSSKDVAFVKPLVELIASIGIEPENLFCASVNGYGVPLNSRIYDYLKEQFENYNLIVIFVLSENYYNSPASLNEMGAAWVLQYKYTSILLPGFEFKQITGAIDPTQISIKLDSDKSELKLRLSELRNVLINEFQLKRTLDRDNIWEQHRDDFIDKVSFTKTYWEIIYDLDRNHRPYEEWLYPLQKILKIDSHSYNAAYMLGIVYEAIGDFENAIKNLETAKKISSNNEEREKAEIKIKDIKGIV